MMKRRQFTQSFAAGALLAGHAGANAAISLVSTAATSAVDPKAAAANPIVAPAIEGREFRTLAKPVTVTGNKIEVLEFFGYWCPHCHGFDPKLESWVRSLDKNKVSFRRVPVAIRPNQEPLRKAYLAMESLGLLEQLHPKVFAAVHVQRRRMDSDSDVANFFLQMAGADGKRVVETMESFLMNGKVSAAKRAFEAFGVEGVPMLAIHGKWLTGPGFDINFDRTLAVADQLIASVAKK